MTAVVSWCTSSSGGLRRLVLPGPLLAAAVIGRGVMTTTTTRAMVLGSGGSDVSSIAVPSAAAADFPRWAWPAPRDACPSEIAAASALTSSVPSSASAVALAQDVGISGAVHIWWTGPHELEPLLAGHASPLLDWLGDRLSIEERTDLLPPPLREDEDGGGGNDRAARACRLRIVSRAALRLILPLYLGPDAAAPPDVGIATGDRGKPELIGIPSGAGGEKWTPVFSVAHTDRGQDGGRGGSPWEESSQAS